MTDQAVTVRRVSRSRRLLALALLAALMIAAAVVLPRLQSTDPTQSARLGDLVHGGQARGFNLILITLDTTRKDALGCYGYRRAETPALDSLATRGVRFDDVVASAPITATSHATMLTGLYPPNHGVRNNGTHALLPEQDLLAECLKRHGYDTAAVVASFVLDRRYGFAQGFDHYDIQLSEDQIDRLCLNCSKRPGDQVSDAAIEWLKRRQAAGAATPFFLWVHYYDPHTPYGSAFVKLPRFAGRPYDAEIAFMDFHLKRLLDQIDRQGLRDRTLIAVATDHGESLGEHEEQLHGMLVYGCTINVGLILSCPALFDRGYRVDDRIVSLVDLRPTIEDLLGISPLSPTDGISLLKIDAETDRAVYMETLMPLYTAAWSPLYALRRHADKYILAPEAEYYDLERDSHELRNLHSTSPRGLPELEGRLAAMMEQWPSESEAAQSTRTMTAEEINRLSSLGYVGGAAPTSAADLPDPKSMMRVYNMASEARHLFTQGKFDEALPLAEVAAAASPGFISAQDVLAKIYMKLHRPNDAADTLRRSVEHNPNFESVRALAELLLELNRYTDLEALLDKAEALDPGSGEVAVLRGDYMAQRGLKEEARQWYQRAMESDEARLGVVAREKLARLAPP